MDGECSMYGREEIDNFYKKPEEKRPLLRLRHQWDNNNVNLDLKGNRVCGMDSSASGQRPTVAYCEDSNKP
jgi:hypothetical protein